MSTRFSILRRVTGCGMLVAIVLSAHPVLAAEQPATVDPRVSTYAERQAIRDRYPNQLDNLTFNDELGDGVPLEQALADALNAHMLQIQSKAR
jgi:hypothetical protein